MICCDKPVARQTVITSLERKYREWLGGTLNKHCPSCMHIKISNIQNSCRRVSGFIFITKKGKGLKVNYTEHQEMKYSQHLINRAYEPTERDVLLFSAGT